MAYYKADGKAGDETYNEDECNHKAVRDNYIDMQNIITSSFHKCVCCLIKLHDADCRQYEPAECIG